MSTQASSPLYFIPGWAFHSAVFKIPAFACFTEASYLDYFNVKSSTLETVSTYLSDFIADQSTVVAWSLGGLFALNIAYHFPQKIKKLVLIASQPRFLADHDWQGISDQTANRFMTQSHDNLTTLLTYFLKLVNYPNRCPQHKRELSKHVIHDHTSTLSSLLNIMFTTDLRAQYPSIQASLLHIINSKDGVLTQNESQLKQLNNGAQQIITQPAGHAGFLTHGESVTQLIKDFINQ